MPGFRRNASLAATQRRRRFAAVFADQCYNREQNGGERLSRANIPHESLAQTASRDQRGLKSLHAMQQDRNNWVCRPGSGGCCRQRDRDGSNEWEVYE